MRVRDVLDLLGRNLTDRCIADDEMAVTFANHMRLAIAICRELYPAFDGFALARRMALVSMAFNPGRPRLAGFRRMRAAINRCNWRLAAHQGEHSLWARQTRHRADEISALLRAGDQV